MNLYNHESEGILLSSMVCDNSAIDSVLPRLSSSDFDLQINKIIFDTIFKLHNSGVSCDSKTVTSEIRKAYDSSYVIDASEVLSMSSSAANIDYYLGIVKDLSIRRATRGVIDDATGRLYHPTEKAVDITSDVEKRIGEIALGNCSTSYKHTSKYLGDVCEDLDWYIETLGKIKGVPAPFSGLESITGFRNGEYIIIASRPSIGKTALALNMIEKIAIIDKVPTGLFSVEMSARQLNMRLLCTRCNFSSYGVVNGMYRSTKDKEKMHRALTEIADATLFVDETSSIRLSELRTKMRRMARIDKCKIVFIDYIGLIDSENPSIPRHEQVAEISRAIKAMAKELDIPIVVLSQLTRDMEGKRPTLNSLAETRALEQDADVVMFLHRERIDSAQSEPADGIPTELIVAKNRNGPTGVANLLYKPRITKFVDAETPLHD